MSFPFSGVLPLNLYPLALFGILTGRSSFSFLLLWRARLWNSSPYLWRSLPRSITCSSLISQSFALRLSPLFTLCLIPLPYTLCGILWATSLTNSFSVLLGLFVFTSRKSSLPSRPRTLSVSPCAPSRPLSKNAICFFIWDVIASAYSLAGLSPPSVFLPSSVSSSSVLALLFALMGFVGWLLRGLFTHNAPLASILFLWVWFGSIGGCCFCGLGCFLWFSR